jgi:uncharacterized peroxidase-related enzyme
MARLPLTADHADIPAPVAAVYAEIRQELGFGMVPNVFLAMASNPAYLRAQWDAFRATILRGQLPRTLKEMLGVLISQYNGSAYARAVHLHGLSALGMSDEVLQMLVTDYERCPLPDRDKDILRFGLLAATDPLGLDDTHYAQLRSHELTDGEILEVIATAQLFTAVNIFTDSIDLEIDQL